MADVMKIKIHYDDESFFFSLIWVLSQNYLQNWYLEVGFRPSRVLHIITVHLNNILPISIYYWLLLFLFPALITLLCISMNLGY